MKSIFMLLGAACSIGALVCYIIILIDAFKKEVWKGLLCLVCGLYGLYYMFAEFDHEKKWAIIGGALGGGILGSVFQMMAR